MGADNFEVIEYGSDVFNAFNRACVEAEEEFGHQEGYSGHINMKYSCREIKVPTGLSVKRFMQKFYEWEGWHFKAEDYRCGSLQQMSAKKKPPGVNTYVLRKEVRDGKTIDMHYSWWGKPIAPPACPVKQELADLFASIYPAFADKGGPALYVEYRGAELTEIKKQLRISAKRGMRVFVFFGVANS
jgi:hypothetical protein